ncbi:prepilin-type N-terminal cleavage/methylation domain-containing protein [Clostridium sp.]|jgi:prepilin-type N-terminal cleavage/methylation domain-containing protein|uniref:prepilin-type N-terminal cleavage/methylation domain-containing protein n=1 Tax=Clostridium sp. TaxID=1506 RepID=UPI00259100C9|nr:prepilin-type N-terminal cleavage/methylation domain-containing protein [Clostridium sp.]MDF2503005.1 prepilin-type N-terminal cleavage/methylation protein [Clostridium sp.]
MKSLKLDVLSITRGNIELKIKKKGFTLIEIIAVIAILAILGAILVPNVLGYRKKAEKSNIQTSAKTVVSAIEAYNSDKGSINDQIGDTSESFIGKITYGDGIDKLIDEEILESDKVPACLNGDKEVNSMEKLNKVASGSFSITNLDGKASTIKIDGVAD